MSDFVIPPVGFGPGSQPAPEGELEYMPMPQEMRTFEASAPYLEDTGHLRPALAIIEELAAMAARVAEEGRSESIDLAPLDHDNRALVHEVMGHGEVSAKIRGIPAVAVQESVFAGVWALAGSKLDRVEVAAFPWRATLNAFAPERAGTGKDTPRGAGVVNAPPVLSELMDKSAAYAPGDPVHVVNLSLLPHTEQDLAWLDAALGVGAVTILSRGYGNCRVTATALPHVWRVQFFNSMDTLILDTLEVTTMPEVALAAPEDLRDSAERLLEVLEAIR